MRLCAYFHVLLRLAAQSCIVAAKNAKLRLLLCNSVYLHVFSRILLCKNGVSASWLANYQVLYQKSKKKRQFECGIQQREVFICRMKTKRPSSGLGYKNTNMPDGSP